MNKRILLIDDEPDILKTLEMTLTQEGYRVTTATRGEVGLEMFRKQPFELVITDMRMPGIDGIEVIRQVKELDPDVEAIVLTGYATLENAIISLRNVGALDYLTKPLENIDELFMAVERALEKRRLSLENRALLQDLKEKEEALARQNRALRESEVLKQAILDGLASTLCFVNRELEIVWANRAVEQATGLTMEGLVGRTCPDVWGMGPESREDCPLIKALKSGKSERAIMEYPNARIMSVRADPVIDDTGRILGLLRIADDITEQAQSERALRESEKKYRELADSLPVKLFEADAKGTVTFLNPFALERLQYTREDLAKGLQLQDMLDPVHWFKAQEGQKIVAEESSDIMESMAKRKDGTTYPVLVNIHPIIKENRLLGLRGFAVDITEREQRLEEMTRMAKLESLGTLAGGIAHDFNNLLGIILGNIELARWDMSPETPSAQALKEAEEGCLAAKELTGQFITLSRGGGPRLRVTAVDTLLGNTVPLSLSGSNVRSEFGMANDLYLVELDERQMGQVIHNLIRNAIEAMPDGGTVQVRAENVVVTAEGQAPVPEMPEGRYIKLEIQDEGTGISEEHKSRVFDPYFSTKIRGTQKGMGLGLSTAFSIVKKHGGFMLLESDGATGTTVSIYLAAIPEEREGAHGSAATEAEGKRPSKGQRILVMDDEAMLRNMAEKMLHLLGYEAETVGNGKEAVEAYRKSLKTSKPFDLVLLDLTVKGGQGGREAIRDLLKVNPEVRAVVCSGYADDPVMSNCEQYGFRASLAKPFTRTSIMHALKKALA
ncbi:MAG: response regulator [Deltaproteobacteria bacterium]|nr:response regulator [Deltaproteobacteria bacterium]